MIQTSTTIREMKPRQRIQWQFHPSLHHKLGWTLQWPLSTVVYICSSSLWYTLNLPWDQFKSVCREKKGGGAAPNEGIYSLTWIWLLLHKLCSFPLRRRLCLSAPLALHEIHQHSEICIHRLGDRDWGGGRFHRRSEADWDHQSVSVRPAI